MNKINAIQAAVVLDRTYLEPRLCPPVRHPNGEGISHLRWMVSEIAKEHMSEGKTMRWLGYIQGAIVTLHIASLEDMKAINAAHRIGSAA